MGLADRLRAARGENPVSTQQPSPVEADQHPPHQPAAAARMAAPPEPPAQQSSPRLRADTDATSVPTSLAQRSGPARSAGQDAVRALKERTTATLYERLGNRLNDASLTDDQLQELVQKELAAIIEGESLAMTGSERRRLLEEVQADVLGLGPIQGLLADPSVTEVMVNGPDKVYVEHAGRIYRSDVVFRDETHLRQIIDRIVGRIGAPHRRGVAVGGRPSGRRVSRQRHHPSARLQRVHLDHPKVQPRRPQRRRSDQARHHRRRRSRNCSRPA